MNHLLDGIEYENEEFIELSDLELDLHAQALATDTPSWSSDYAITYIRDYLMRTILAEFENLSLYEDQIEEIIARYFEKIGVTA